MSDPGPFFIHFYLNDWKGLEQQGVNIPPPDPHPFLHATVYIKYNRTVRKLPSDIFIIDSLLFFSLKQRNICEECVFLFFRSPPCVGETVSGEKAVYLSCQNNGSVLERRRSDGADGGAGRRHWPCGFICTSQDYDTRFDLICKKL